MNNTLAPLFVVGYPGPVGGACTELWHTLKLWRQFGLDVHLIPTWGDPGGEWKERVSAIGCHTHAMAKADPEQLRAVPGLAGGILVSFCNENFLHSAEVFRDLGCKMVFVNCMNWLFAGERRFYAKRGPFDAYVCQSAFQRDTLGVKLAAYGVKPEQLHLIRGAFDPTEFTYSAAPRDPAAPFVLGRVSRAAPDKFSTNTWSILNRVNYRPIRYRVMGWEPAVEKQIGKPPAYAEVMKCQTEPVDQFMKSLHCYCQISGGATENWPRAGLEAMASGVPICVERRGGWPEMIEHRRSGFVCESDQEIAHWISQLAWDDTLRLEIAARAYRRLLTLLADPEEIWDGWRKLFESLVAQTSKLKSA